MNTADAGELPTSRKRLWFLLAVLAGVLWLVRFGIPIVMPAAIVVGLIGGLVGALAVIVWWAFLSRAPRLDRWAPAPDDHRVGRDARIVDKSIATGLMGMMFPIYAVPVLGLAFLVWATFRHRLSDGPRRASMVATILLACGAWTLVRTNGITGEAASDFAWRWSKTPEQRLLAQPDVEPVPPPALPAAPAPAAIPAERLAAKTDAKPVSLPPTPAPAKSEAAWSGFRGPGRDSIIPGIQINTEWSATPPVQLWRRSVGPGWSSFAVQGDLLYTQEQRGEDEVVACYDAATGKPVWVHRDPARFWESNAGAGPRATPTLHDGHVYTFGRRDRGYRPACGRCRWPPVDSRHCSRVPRRPRLVRLTGPTTRAARYPPA